MEIAKIGDKVLFKDFPGIHTIHDITHADYYPGGHCYKMRNEKDRPVHFNVIVFKEQFKRYVE